MANPFPGMDPYLEGDLWTSVHNDLAAEIARQLSPQIRPKYLALSTRRIVLATPDETERPSHRLPDVSIVARRESETTNGGVAIAPLTANALMPEAIPQTTIEIRDVARRRLVTAIEVLSPTNKRGDGQYEYVSKRRQVLSSDAHLVEIDLIRVGQRFPLDRTLPSVSYFVFISRLDRRPRVDYWPILLAQPLPKVPIPLLSGDPDAWLDLQSALSVVYDVIGYDEGIDYTGPPPGPLSAEDAAWVDQRLREAGKRK